MMLDQQPGPTPRTPSRLPPLGLTVGIVAYAVAMAYLESAVVVYLRAALGVPTGTIFPIDLSPAAMPFGWIEVGREGRRW